MTGTDRLIAADSLSSDECKRHVLGGGCVAYYCDYRNARDFAGQVMEDAPHDVWYTERNGDPITLICPKDTPMSRLPSSAKGYWIAEWITPEMEFSGHYAEP